jgi:hypothetical protein
MTDGPALIFTGLVLALLGLLLWADVWEDKAHQRAVAHCQERQMVLVDTPAGERCSHVWALEPTRR